MSQTKLSKTRPWWLVPLLLLTVMLFVPQGARADADYNPGFRDYPVYYYNNGDPYIAWSTTVYAKEGNSEYAFIKDYYNDYDADIYIGPVGQSLSYCGSLIYDEDSENAAFYIDNYKQTLPLYTNWTTIPSVDIITKWYFTVESATESSGFFQQKKSIWVTPHWKVPLDFLNTNLNVRVSGKWDHLNTGFGTTSTVDATMTVPCPYTFTIRQIEWDGDYDVTPDGTVTIPFKFTGSEGNTDGHTHICTRIDNRYNGTIGLKTPAASYAAGHYSFKLSDIGKNFGSTFSIEPYHEFTHYFDRDNGNSTKNYSTSAGIKTFSGMPVATISSAVFNQADKTVTLNWKANHTNFAVGNWGTRWVIYRNGTKIATVLQDQSNNPNFVGNKSYRFVDTNVQTEQEYIYTIYYVWKGWNENAQVNELRSNELRVSTVRDVPVNNMDVVSEDDRIVFSWTSDGYEANWCQFKVYIDAETDPVCTISPTEGQTAFRWEHRYADHENRTTSTDNGVPYAEEKLNGCDPHDYRIEGIIKGTKKSEVQLNDKGIGSDTRFLSFKATKGVFPGTVKLSWQVDQKYPDKTKTYIVQRRTAEREDEAWTTLHRTSGNDEYMFYTDETPLPGVYYDYLVTVQDKCDNGNIVSNEATDVGFAQTTGTVSGRITYGTTGMAVKGVDVEAQKTGSEGDDLAQYHAMYFDSTNGVVTWDYPSATYAKDKFATGDFTIQLWIKPEAFADYWVARLHDNRAVGISSSGELLFCDGSRQYGFNIFLKKDAYNHVAVTRSGNTVTAYLLEPVEDGEPIVTKNTKTIGTLNLTNAQRFELGYFKGYADEFRLWTKCLTETEIRENFDRLLVGNERGLETYWTFDEGLKKQFFDYSREGTVYHEHHGKLGSNTKPKTDTPDALSLKAKTDQNGNYIIMGVPFSGEGTTYAIVPTMGVHDFNPQQHLRYVGNNSLVHNGVDFDDVSSFKVTGAVYYENTTIPVTDAYLYIDGIMASKDGEPVMTNSEGKYEISVPIGDHFVQVKKQGHTFLNNGRYPNDPDGLGLRETFNDEVSDLTFYDQTTVTVAGRVAGGDIEYEKALGLGQGKNNIGKATLHLELESDKFFLNADKNNDISKVQRDFETSYGQAYVPASKNYIAVETDPATGEWVAQLLPLRYVVTSVTIPSRPDNDMIDTQNFTLPIIDATNPDLTYTDSVEVDGEWKKFEYVGAAKLKYKSPSTIEVTENKDGSFGMKDLKLKDIQNKEHIVKLYDYDDETGKAVLDADGKVHYTFGVTNENPYGYPVYQELSSYKYRLYAYERYTNYDNGEAAVDEVPLAGKTVTIKNQFASTTSVSKADGTVGQMADNKLELDDNGKATYNFTVGFPNIQEPYTRGLSISYDNNGTEIPWQGNSTFKVIVLGGLPTGNNFVTQGPDEVLMVLRDPPGTGSQTTWSKGTSITRTKTTTSEYNNNTGVESTIYAGVETATGAGIGFMVITDLDSKVNIEAGAEYSATRTSGNTTVSTTTTTRDISTSDAMDFVGAVGDVFIGSSKNIIFGACRSVDIKWNNQTGEAELVQEDAISMGEEFTTSFNYEQNYIKNVLIPNFEDLRNKLLTKVSSVTGVPRPAKGSKEALYVTTLTEDDPRFGSSNDDFDVWQTDTVQFGRLKDGVYSGPSYTMLLPIDYEKDSEGMQDMVKYYNTQISRWENELRKNEEAKVKAMNDRKKYLKENLSFSAGASITQTVECEDGSSTTSSQSDGFNITLGLETGFRFSGLGLGVHVTEQNGGTWTSEEEEETTETTSMSYTLLEDGDDDYLSVDVYSAPDGFGPIFVTRGGATSCPYEDEVVTEYYLPGTVISKKTVQIEKPEIEAQTQIITGIPAGGTGTFKVNIRNNSDTGEDLWFDLKVSGYSNPDGLDVSMDGVNLNKGNTILVKAGETMEKTITVSQTDLDVLKYENVVLRIASQCQKDNTSTYAEIADSTEFSCFFQPSCSDIKLETSHTIVNTDTEEQVTLSMSGYNYSMASLTGIRLEYKGINDANFHELKTWMKTPKQGQEQLNPLEGTEKLTYRIDLRSTDFDDKTYVFRAVTICDKGDEYVYNESDEVNIIRDMSCPQLIATPSPASGILNSGSDLLLTFNEDIQNSILTQPNNFKVVGVLNESEVVHDVALSLSGESVAKTEAPIDLSGKSFSAGLWVNYTSDGTLLTHGTKDNNFTVAIEDGKLAVTVAGQKASSTATLPKSKWLYLNVSYNASDAYSSTPTLNAGYAQDATTVTLLNGVATTAYEGNGAISLGGNNLSAQVQELSLWNSGRSMSEALANMHTTKSQFTNGLIGYWQFDEGHGSTATDKARSRHITLPSQNAWWINGTNYAITLNGKRAAAVNIANLNTTGNEDYLVETWFKAETSQTAVASILNTPKMDLRLNTQGALEIVLDGSTVEISDKTFRDGEWHHLAVSVLKSTGGSGNIYVDGQQYKQIAASAMPELFGEKLALGGKRYLASGVYKYTQMLNGAIDEVRIWKGRRTADVIKNNMYARVKGDEPGLVAYYPMEKSSRNSYNQVVAEKSLEDAIPVAEGVTSETLQFFNASGTQITSTSSYISSASTPALKQAPRMENVQFSFVASERQIKVNIEEEPERIEDCNIYVTVKNVKDLHGNMAEPITWGVYVQQNNLKWQENEVSVVKNDGEKATFMATIENRGSEDEVWSLSGLPAWLTASAEGGTLKPLATGTLTFTVAESMATGNYEQTVYLTGTQNISTPLTLKLKVKGEEPDWAVNAADYEETMNVIGNLRILGISSQDEDDIVAAFIGGECRGIAHPEYKSRYDSYFVTLDVYGNGSDAGLPVIFKVFDASAATIYPMVATTLANEALDINYEANDIQGTFKYPVTFNATDMIEQNVDMAKGWNWISLNVRQGDRPEDMTPATVFANANGRAALIKSKTKSASYVTADHAWMGDLKTLNNADMYLVSTTEAFTLSVTGHRVNPADEPVTVKEGWNWIAYNGQQIISLEDALAAFNPQDGDLIKGQKGVAIHDGYEWMGSLKALVPGKGYKMKNSGTERTFSYPSSAAYGSSTNHAPRINSQSSMVNGQCSVFEPVDCSLYPANMVIIAQVVKDGMPMEGVEVGVFAGDECREAAMADTQGMVYMTIPGNSAMPLTFRIAEAGSQLSTLNTKLTYQTDAVVGSPRAPFIIDLGAATGIGDAAIISQPTEEVYDLSGRKIDGSKIQVPGSKLSKGVYIVNGRKIVR